MTPIRFRVICELLDRHKLLEASLGNGAYCDGRMPYFTGDNGSRHLQYV